jgi:hypothetical protein
MRFTRARDLAAAGAVALVAVHLLVRVAYGSLPQLPTLAGVTLLVLAIVEAVLGTSIRDRIKRKFEGRPDDGRPLQPLAVARAVALAKASSLLGAIMLGAWLGILAYVLPRRDEFDAAAHDTTSTIVGVICSALLIAGALWLEYCCRAPDDQRPPRDGQATSGA